MIEELFAKHTPELQSMDHKKIEPILEKFITMEPFIKLMYVVDINGHKITDNITQPEDANKYAKLAENFSDREWFKKALSVKQAKVSYFYISQFINELCITVSKRITSEDGKIIGVLGLDINFDNLIKID